MALLCPNVGEVKALDMWLSDAAPENQQLRLYKNDIDPAEGDTAATYTEATILGYVAVSLLRITWGAAATAAGVTSKSYPAQVFAFTGTGTVVGYYIVGLVSGVLLWAERMFASPGQTFNNLDTLTVTVKIQLE